MTQLSIARKYYVSRILATPHFYPNAHTVSSFLSTRAESIKMLKDSRLTTMPEFKVGAEVLICEGLERLPQIDKLCFDGTNYIMLELPFSDFSEGYITTVSSLISSGFEVVLAHVDRYPCEYIDALIDCGVKNLQLNASALFSLFPHKSINRWLGEGLITMLGSDIHGSSRQYYKKFMKAKDKLTHFISYIKDSSDSIWNKINSI